jgi:C-terminal processing protease CtpA/Prc
MPSSSLKLAKLDIAYSFLSDTSVHRPTSAQLLRGALDGMRREIAASGGSGDVPTPTFTTDASTSLPDFRMFGTAAIALAAANPRIPADRLVDAAIVGMIQADPDCHTYYQDARGSTTLSRAAGRAGTGPQLPAGGVAIQGQPDQAGVQATLLPNGVAYITWHAFEVNGTYRITDAVRAVLDRSLAAGAKAWLFDLRGNVGGNGADVMASWFLDGQPTLRRIAHDGGPDLLTANRDLRLGAAYQLPIAVILNDRGGSSPEVFALSLRENKRATIVGATSTGCLGGMKDVPLGSDGSYIFVAIHEYVGAVTGARYNNVGIPPDVAATDASAVAVATALLLERMRFAP